MDENKEISLTNLEGTRVVSKPALEYEPTEWKAGREGGTAWTPARLNNIEQGILQATNRLNEDATDIENVKNDISQINSNLVKQENGTIDLHFDTSIQVAEITFKEPFNNPPIVQVNANLATEYWSRVLELKVIGVTNVSFYIAYSRSDAVLDYTVFYTAIGN